MGEPKKNEIRETASIPTTNHSVLTPMFAPLKITVKTRITEPGRDMILGSKGIPV